MSSTFGGLNTALSALYAQRHGMNVAGQNVANANTEGYSRQRTDMVPMGGSVIPALFSTPAVDGGNGVRVDNIARLRDAFLESRGRAEHSQSTYLSDRQEMFGRLENVYAEVSDTALGSQMADFWAGWGDVANRPGDDAARTQLLERSSVVADGLRAGWTAMASQWDSGRVQLDALATQVNNAADAVAQLNQAITQAQASGLPSNELKDTRDLRLMELAELTGATTVARENGSVDVFVGGSTLVGGAVSRHIEVNGAFRLEDQAGSPVGLNWTDNGLTANIATGHIGAGLDTVNVLIPQYAGELDTVAVALATTVNTVHQAGYGRDGVTGRDMFVDSSGGVVGMTARTISVGLTGPQEVAAGSVGGTLDGSNAAKIAALATLANGPDAQYRKAVVQLGVESQTAQRRADIQSQISADMDAMRFADSGVNLDEEMTNLVSYQKAYEAAARVMTSIDEALDVLINRTGLVGR